MDDIVRDDTELENGSTLSLEGNIVSVAFNIVDNEYTNRYLINEDGEAKPIGDVTTPYDKMAVDKETHEIGEKHVRDYLTNEQTLTKTYYHKLTTPETTPTPTINSHMLELETICNGGYTSNRYNKDTPIKEDTRRFR